MSQGSHHGETKVKKAPGITNIQQTYNTGTSKAGDGSKVWVLHVLKKTTIVFFFVCVVVLWPSHVTEVMSTMVSLPNHTFTGQA